MKPLSLLTLAATFSLLALRPSVVRAQTEHPYTLTEGSYQGSFVRLAAAVGSVPERGDVRLELEPSGLLHGVLSRVGGNPPDLYTSVKGQIDPVSRRGFLRVLRSDKPGGPLYPVPGSEKLAVLLYPDGRLVGGIVDAQGTAMALRATFLPLVLLPPGPSMP